MPLTENMSKQAQVLVGVVVAALAYVGLSMGMLPVEAITASSDILLGLAVIALVGWWAFSEAEDDDGIADVVDKTTDRAENASKGFLEGTSALIIGGVAVALTVGSELLGLLFGLVDIASTAPGVAGTIGAGIAGLAGMLGFLNVTTLAVVVVAIVLLVVYSRMDS